MSLTFSTMAALRFGTGFRAGQTPPESVEEMLAQIDASRAETLTFPQGGLDVARDRMADMAERLIARRDTEKDMDDIERRASRRRYNGILYDQLTKEEHARIIQSVMSPNGFNERLASFWFNHFSVNSHKAHFMRLLVPAYEAEAIRPNMGGRFADLAKAAVLHPAMLVYLDQIRSIGPGSRQGQSRERGLNENLGRELLELHTLGAGSGYTQTDVRNAAFILTGMTINRRTYEARYAVNVAEPGAKEVFGKSYGGDKRRQDDVEAMINDLAAAPQTRQHICAKMARHFLSDTPPPEVVAVMTEAWTQSDGDLTAVYTAMLQHKRSWDDEMQKAKLPFDYIVSGLRALSAGEGDMADLGLTEPGRKQATLAADEEDKPMSEKPAEPAMAPADTTMDEGPRRIRVNPLTVRAVQRLGQPVWQPPSPAGFDDGFTAWIAGGPLADRIAWARLATATLGADLDPRTFLRDTLRDAARQDTIDIVARAPNRQMGVTLVLAAPEFNRR